METELLKGLGVIVNSEAALRKDIIRNEVVKNFRFDKSIELSGKEAKMYHSVMIPSLSLAVPDLSPKYLNKLVAMLKEERDRAQSERDVSVIRMKILFLETKLMKLFKRNILIRKKEIPEAPSLELLSDERAAKLAKLAKKTFVTRDDPFQGIMTELKSSHLDNRLSIDKNEIDKIYDDAEKSVLMKCPCPFCHVDVECLIDAVDISMLRHLDICSLNPRKIRESNSSSDSNNSCQFQCEICRSIISVEDIRDLDFIVSKHTRLCKSQSIDAANIAAQNDRIVTVDNFEENGYDDNVQVEHHALRDDWVLEQYRKRLEDEEIINWSTRRERASFVDGVYGPSWTTLHEYQKKGCQWMHALYTERVGGILGDEMGLGKTAQLCVHLDALSQRIRQESVSTMPYQGLPKFLIICPTTVLSHWLSEMHRWAPMIRTLVFHRISPFGQGIYGRSQRAIERQLKEIFFDNDTFSVAIIMSYDGIKKHLNALKTFEWTGVCLDEGQIIRNPETNISKCCKQLSSCHRIILSGTPIQNSLKELWSLFDFVYPGKLGSFGDFDNNYIVPIRNGGYAGASALQSEAAIQCATRLQMIIRPFLLRRKKDDPNVQIALPEKTEQVLLCRMSPRQRELYRRIISSSEVKAVIELRAIAFRSITTLRKLCNHPALVLRAGRLVWHSIRKRKAISNVLHESKSIKHSKNRSENSLPFSPSSNEMKTQKISGRLRKRPSISYKDTDGSLSDEEVNEFSAPQSKEMLCNRKTGVVIHEVDDESEDDLTSDSTNRDKGFINEEENDEEEEEEDDDIVDLNDLKWEDSGKLIVLSKLLPLWKKEGHKVLIFSQTRVMLSLLERLMREEVRASYLRLDGNVSIHKRGGIIRAFNDPEKDIFAMLLTTRTGGVGISLTAADRVILLDPDWNPMTDIQARERAWRIGQKRPVTVFRLISKGTIEEKIYQRQIFKLLLSNRILESAKQKALFSKSSMRDLFEFQEDDDDDADLMMSHSSSAASSSSSMFPRQAEVAFPKSRGSKRSGRSTRNLQEVISSSTSNDENREHKLIEVLFSGQAIGGVYNHNMMESYGSSRRNSSSPVISTAPLSSLFSSSPFSSSSSSSSTTSTLPFPSAAVKREAVGVNTSNILQHIQTRDINDEIKTRLVNIFERLGDCGITLEEVKDELSDLTSDHDLIVRLLNFVAVRRCNLWYG